MSESLTSCQAQKWSPTALVWPSQDVLFGTSYYAVVQPPLAARQPPAFRGFYEDGLDTDYIRHTAVFGKATKPAMR